MKKTRKKIKLDNGAIYKLASLTSVAIKEFKQKQKQKKKELEARKKKEEFSKLNIEKKELNKRFDELKKKER